MSKIAAKWVPFAAFLISIPCFFLPYYNLTNQSTSGYDLLLQVQYSNINKLLYKSNFTIIMLVYIFLAIPVILNLISAVILLFNSKKLGFILTTCLSSFGLLVYIVIFAIVLFAHNMLASYSITYGFYLFAAIQAVALIFSVLGLINTPHKSAALPVAGAEPVA